jgi:hypothetical protein
MTEHNPNRCKQCGFRIRGKNHEQGVHYQSQNRPAHKPRKKTRK